jgi:hypothetical protein
MTATLTATTSTSPIPSGWSWRRCCSPPAGWCGSSARSLPSSSAPTSTSRCGWSTCSASSCGCRAPGTTPPKSGHPPLNRCCRARSAYTPPRCSPSGSPPSLTGCWSGWSRPGPAAGASNAVRNGRAGGSCAACSCSGRGGGASSSAAATASETASSVGCTWPSNNATRCWPLGHRDPSRPMGWSSRRSWSGRATWSPPRSNPMCCGPPAPTGPASGPSGSTTPSA